MSRRVLHATKERTTRPPGRNKRGKSSRKLTYSQSGRNRGAIPGCVMYGAASGISDSSDGTAVQLSRQSNKHTLKTASPLPPMLGGERTEGGYTLKFLLLVTTLALSGCSGRMVCEWESQDERFEALIEEVLNREKVQTRQTEGPPDNDSRQQNTSRQYQDQTSARRNTPLTSCPA